MNKYKYVTVVREYITKLDEYQLTIKVGKKEADTGIIFFDEDKDIDIDSSPVEYGILDYIQFDQIMTFDEIEKEVNKRDITTDDYQRVPNKVGDHYE